MKIRPAVAADIPTIVEMSRKFYETTTYTAHAAMCDESVARLSETLADNHVLLVAEIDGRASGMIGMFVAPNMFNNAVLTAHEVVWWVEPSALGAGTGRALIESAIAECKARGCAAVQMVTLSTSPPQAAALYQKLGFVHSESSYTLTTEG